MKGGGWTVTNEAIGPQVPRLLGLPEATYSFLLFVPWLPWVSLLDTICCLSRNLEATRKYSEGSTNNRSIPNFYPSWFPGSWREGSGLRATQRCNGVVDIVWQGTGSLRYLCLSPHPPLLRSPCCPILVFFDF